MLPMMFHKDTTDKKDRAEKLLEEVGLKAKLVKVFAVFDAINPKNFFRKAHFIFCELLQ